MNKPEFFNFNIHQSVNSTLLGIFLASWCLLMMVYYFNRSVSMMEASTNGAKELLAIMGGKDK